MTDSERPTRGLNEELIEAFVRLARADFSVRLPRNFRRDTEDMLATFVNLIAEELGRLTAKSEASKRRLEVAVEELGESFLRLAAGDYAVRVQRTSKGDPLDVVAFLFNNTAAEVGDAVAQLDDQRQLVEAILESMVEGVLLLDSGAVIRRCNGAFARMVGQEADALVGQRLATVLAPGEQALPGELVAHRETAQRRDVTFRTASGEPVLLSVSGSPHRDVAGRAGGIVLVARDERELKQAHAQLQLSDRLATMGTLAAGVAHEVNNPLAFMVGNLDFIAEELDELGAALPAERISELRRAIQSTQEGAQRVGQIVRDLKALSRVDEEKRSRVELPRVAAAALHMVRNEVRHRARVATEYGPTPAVEGNEARLMQVLLNLLQNAAHAIPAGHAADNEIRVTTGTEATGEAFLAVQDSGDGIPPEVLPRIFDAFFTTKPLGAGTGLGLSICHKIVAQMGGRIDVESALGRGSTFRVTLPASTAPVSRPGGLAEARTGVAPRRVLVVDDEREVGTAFARVLGREHEVVAVTRGDEALRLLEAERFDVIFCDLMMPEMTGMELYERLAARDPAQAARVIFMTGGSSDHRIRDFLRGVPNGLVDKPCDSRTLRAVVARVAEGGG